MGKVPTNSLKLSWDAPRSKEPSYTEILELIFGHKLPVPQAVLAIFNDYACLQMQSEADAQRLFNDFDGKILDRWGTLTVRGFPSKQQPPSLPKKVATVRGAAILGPQALPASLGLLSRQKDAAEASRDLSFQREQAAIERERLAVKQKVEAEAREQAAIERGRLAVKQKDEELRTERRSKEAAIEELRKTKKELEGYKRASGGLKLIDVQSTQIVPGVGYHATQQATGSPLRLLPAVAGKARNWEIQTSYERLSQSPPTFRTTVNISKFPAFVVSNARVFTDHISVNGTEWQLLIQLNTFDEGISDFRDVESILPEPANLAIYIVGRKGVPKDCSFNVHAKFGLMRGDNHLPYTYSSSHEFVFNAANKYKYDWGVHNLQSIRDLINQDKGFMTGNDSLVLFVEIAIESKRICL